MLPTPRSDTATLWAIEPGLLQAAWHHFPFLDAACVAFWSAYTEDACFGRSGRWGWHLLCWAFAAWFLTSLLSWRRLGGVTRLLYGSIVLLPLAAAVVCLWPSPAEPLLLSAPMDLPFWQDDANQGALRQLLQIALCLNFALLLLHAWAHGGVGRVALLCGPVGLTSLFTVGVLHGAHALSFAPAEEGWWSLPQPLPQVVLLVTLFYQAVFLTWQMRRASVALRRSPFSGGVLVAALVAIGNVVPDALAQQAQLYAWDASLPRLALLGGSASAPMVGHAWAALTAGVLAWAIFALEQRQHLLPGGAFDNIHRRHLLRRAPLFVGATIVAVLLLARVGEGPDSPTFLLAHHAIGRFVDTLKACVWSA